MKQRRLNGFLALIGAFATLATLSAPAMAQDAASTQDVVTLEPSSKWALDYAEDSCALRRAFGTDEDSVIAQFKMFGPSDWFELTVVSQKLTDSSNKLTVTIEPDLEGARVETFQRGNVGESQFALIYSDSFLPLDEKQAIREAVGTNLPVGSKLPVDKSRIREKATSGFVFSGGFEKPTRLATGSMGKPMEAMRGCLDNLLESWGVDPVKYHSIKTPSKRDGLRSLAGKVQAAYPREMVRRGINAKVMVRIIIGVDGRPESCEAHNPEPYPQFEEAACKQVMRYARYTPALDGEGQPVKSYDRFEVAYSIN